MKIVITELFSQLDMIKALVLCINESIEVIILYKVKELVFAVV